MIYQLKQKSCEQETSKQEQQAEQINIQQVLKDSELIILTAKKAKQYFETISNWPQSQKHRNSEISYRLAYLMLGEITKLALKGTGITFNRVCDKFGIHYKTHDYIKALFGYTISVFPFQQQITDYISDLTKYLQPEHFRVHRSRKGHVKRNIKRPLGKNKFDLFFTQKLQEWKAQRTTNLALLDYVQLTQGLTVRNYVGADPILTEVMTTIEKMSQYI